jgi:hypothetical protein
MSVQIETFELPDFWSSALINGDTSGLTDADEKSFNDFCDFMVNHYGSCWATDCTEEPHFKKYHDATRFGVLACDVLKFSFDVQEVTS